MINTPEFSILIPTWNNFHFMKNVANSIEKNSNAKHEVIFHIQECDSNHEAECFCDTRGYKYTTSQKNIGISAAVNMSAKLATKDYICHMDDDMWVFPGWDIYLYEAGISYSSDNTYWVSSLMIEPANNNSPTGLLHSDFKTAEQTYTELHKKIRPYRNNQCNPVLFSRTFWDKFGGADEDFFGPGFEEGLAMRAWIHGCTDFLVIPKSVVYHYQGQSTGKLEDYATYAKYRNKLFHKKYGITLNEFITTCIRRGEHV